jgi:integrase
LASWDEKRGCFRIVIDVSRPGERRQRKYRDVHVANTRAGKKAAELAEAKLRVELALAAEAAWPGGTGKATTFGSYAADWIERKQGSWSPKTVKETRYALRRYILPTLGSTPLDEVSPAQLERLYATWSADKRSASVRRRWHGMIRTIFSDAERLGELHRPNPMLRVSPAGGRAPERRIPTPEELRAIIDATKSPLAATFFELAAASAARRGSVIALRWRDVDLEVGRVSFIEAVTEGEDGLVVLKENKGGRVYAVGIAGGALEALRQEHRRAAERTLALGMAGGLDNLFIFSDDAGLTHLNVSWPSHKFLESARRAGVSGVHLHDLRHFAASQMLSAGIPTRNVADRLGCTEGNVIRTYSHRVPSPEDARATEIMAAVLS